MLASLRRVVGSLLVATLFLPLGATASQIQNGDFEAGNFGGWKLFDDGATLITATTPWMNVALPPYQWQSVQGNDSAVVIALSGANPQFGGCARDIWNHACTDPAFRYTGDGTTLTYPFNAVLDVNGFPYVFFVFKHSGKIGQDVTVRAGDKLTWDWACISQLGECGDFDRGRFFATNGESFLFIETIVGQLAPAEFLFPTAGLWTIYFGQDQNDGWYWSGLLLDNVVLHETPEPGTVALLSLGLVGLAFTRRRRQ